MKKALKILSLAILIIISNFAILINAVQAVERSKIDIDTNQKRTCDLITGI